MHRRAIGYRLSAPSAALAVLTALPLAGQPIAQRVGSVRDGVVEMTYASRPDACGNGGDFVALGRLVTVYPSIRGHGWSSSDCRLGPVRVVITNRGGEVSSVRVHIGASRSRMPGATADLGAVSAPAAAAYFLDLLPSVHGRAASSAIMAAALADSVDIWRRLLVIARDDDRTRDVRGSALYWLSGTAPSTASGELAALARDAAEPRDVRDAALIALAHLPEGAGVPALIEMTRRDDPERWLRERAIFWLGNADDERGRQTVRALAASDTLSLHLRDQAIFALGHLDQKGGNGPFLRQLYSRLESRQLRAKVIQSMAQLDDDAAHRWLLDLALDESETAEVRKQALFWAGQRRSSSTGDLVAIYPRLRDRDLREHFIFVLSQRRDDAAVEKLIDIARNDPDRATRHKAIFWLGQSRDARAAKFLAEAIEK